MGNRKSRPDDEPPTLRRMLSDAMQCSNHLYAAPKMNDVEIDAIVWKLDMIFAKIGVDAASEPDRTVKFVPKASTLASWNSIVWRFHWMRLKHDIESLEWCLLQNSSGSEDAIAALLRVRKLILSLKK